MIVLRPDQVKFDNAAWNAVIRVSFDRIAARTVEEYDDTGPHPTLIDVPRQRIVVRVTQEIEADDLDAPTPAQLGELELIAGGGSDAGKKRIRCNCVVESVQNRITDFGATRNITLIAQSTAGDQDPVSITNA